MKKIVLINALEKVKKFTSQASRVEGPIYIRQGRYTIDGKSILGILSLNLLDTVTVEYPDNEEDFEKYLQTLE